MRIVVLCGTKHRFCFLHRQDRTKPAVDGLKSPYSAHLQVSNFICGVYYSMFTCYNIQDNTLFFSFCMIVQHFFVASV